MLKLYKLLCKLISYLTSLFTKSILVVLSILLFSYSIIHRLFSELFKKLNEQFWKAIELYLDYVDKVTLAAIRGELSLLDKWTDGAVVEVRRLIRSFIRMFLYFLRKCLILLIVINRKRLFALIRAHMRLSRFISQRFGLKNDNYSNSQIRKLDEFQFDLFYFLVAAAVLIALIALFTMFIHDVRLYPYCTFKIVKTTVEKYFRMRAKFKRKKTPEQQEREERRKREKEKQQYKAAMNRDDPNR